MPTPQELEEKLWKSLKSDMTVMLGLMGPKDSHKRPMTAQIEDGSTTLWFFSAKGTELVDALASGGGKGQATFMSKGHDIFACMDGELRLDNDPATIDRLWNSHVAAWYEKGREDPKIALIRFDPSEAEIWKDGSSLIAGIRSLFGADPKKDYAENTAEVRIT